MVEKSDHLNSCGESELVSGIEEIEGILSRMDPQKSALMQAVDAKGKDYGTYYYTAYSSTLDLDTSLSVYKNVKNLVRLVVLTDRYFEVQNQRYRRLGEGLLARLKREDNGLLRTILKFNVKQFWHFWDFEQFIKSQMLRGYNFSESDVKSFNLFKSSDVALLYAPVLEAMLPRFSHNASVILHYNQALQDIDDDLDDIQEDLRDQMPNSFVLASLSKNTTRPYVQLYRHRLNGSKLTILENASETVLGIVDDYVNSIEGIAVPDQLKFLKLLSKSYAERIRKKLTLRIQESQRLTAA